MNVKTTYKNSKNGSINFDTILSVFSIERLIIISRFFYSPIRDLLITTQHHK